MIGPQTCPICEKKLQPNAAEESKLFPFCSARCKQIDLWRWCEGMYSIERPVAPDDMADEIERQQHDGSTMRNQYE